MHEDTPNEPEASEGVDAGVDALPDGLAAGAATGAGSASGGAARRGLVVLAVFAIVVAGAVAFALAGGDGDADDATTEGEATTEAESDSDDTPDGAGDDAGTDGDESDGEGADSDTVRSIDDDGASDDAESYVVSDMAVETAYYGGEAPMVWGDGFLSIRQEFVPSEVTLPDLIPDLADRFPPEVADALESAGIDLTEPGSTNQAIDALYEAGLYEEVEQIFFEDPELSEAYNEVISGGTYVQVAEYSADGITWEPIDFTFEVPEYSWPDYRSTGDHLVAVVTNNGWSGTGERVDVEVTIHITDDLSTWTTVELPVTIPTVSDYVQQEVWTDQVAVGPTGWYVSVGAHQYIDLWALLPERLQTGSYNWSPTPDGIRIEDWNDDAYYEAELEASESGDWSELENWEPTVVETISWDDLPITYQDWVDSTSGEQGNRQAFVGGFDGSVAPATAPDGVDWFQLASTSEGFIAWGQIHTPSEVTMQELVPDIEERFPVEVIEAWTDAGLSIGDTPSVDEATQILADAGLLDLATETVMDDPELLDAYMQATSGTYETVAFFSADASTWSPVTFPDLEHPDSIVPVDGGVLLIGSSETGQQFWLGDARGSSWEQVDGPDLGENLWVYFDTRSSNGSGLATVVDAAVYEGGVEFVPWTSTVEHDGYELTLSADGEGFQSLAIVEVASGDVVRDTTIEMWTEELFVWSEDSIDFADDDGEVIVSLPQDMAEEFIWQPESEAWDAWYEANPYVPELYLVATVDGRDWVVQQLETQPNDEGWYGGGGAAINNGVAVYRDALGWHRVVVG